MVKKLLILIAVVIGISIPANARDSYARDASVLPKAAQVILTNNFKSAVSVIKIDKDLGRVSEYEVVLTDGSEITFDKNGNWKSVEVGLNNSMPAGFIPSTVADYVKKNVPGQKIIGIEKERSGYEVELRNGVELKFDKQGKFVRFDK